MEGKIKLEPRSKRSKNQSWKARSKIGPEAGRHSSNPVVERSWDAFYKKNKDKEYVYS